MAARAALLREEKEEEARRASEAFAEMRRRADVVSTANSLACRRAGQQPGMLTAESIAARLRAQLRLLEEEENAERGESETATDAVGVAEMARGQGCSGAAREAVGDKEGEEGEAEAGHHREEGEEDTGEEEGEEEEEEEEEGEEEGEELWGAEWCNAVARRRALGASLSREIIALERIV